MSYTPLDTDKNLIRLLHLHPASSLDDAIKCDFSIALLDDKSDYEALSYAWGDAKDTRSIEVEGKTDVPITANFFTALKHLRLEDRMRTLWVDALCINQKDLKERMHQVSKMASIFGQATRVVVWLGEAWDGCETAFQFLQKMADDKTLHLNPLLEPSLIINGLDFDSLELQGNVIRFFNLPWWTRTWTVQECILAQDLVFRCSQNQITRTSIWNALENFYQCHIIQECCFNMNYNDPDPIFDKSFRESITESKKLLYSIYEKSSSYNLLESLAIFSHREATDPRDKIYGMLALGTGPYTDLVEADYTLSTQQVCEEFVIKSVRRTQKLDFMSHICGGRDGKWPSFLPNWTGSVGADPNLTLRLDQISLFNACLNLPAELKHMSQGVIALSGVIFDRVVATSTEYSLNRESHLNPKNLKDLHAIAGICSDPEIPRPLTNDCRLLAFWHSSYGGIECFSDESGGFFQHIESSTDLSAYFKWEEYLTPSGDWRNEMWDSELRLNWTAIETASYERRFFNTEKGHFGWAPRYCEVGDLVVVLAGGNVSYIIRPVSRTKILRRLFTHAVKSSKFWNKGGEGLQSYPEECYTFLGDSYVHGIMDGEVFNLLNENERKLRDIVLV